MSIQQTFLIILQIYTNSKCLFYKHTNTHCSTYFTNILTICIAIKFSHREIIDNKFYERFQFSKKKINSYQTILL